MAIELKPTNIIHSFKMLKGNTRTSIIFEPLWGIPYALYTFYLSLYMKSQGINDQQIGFLISIGFIASIVFSAFGGMITDTLGRKKTTVIFDLISWPLSIFIYIISKSFWMFAVSQIINSMVKITAVSWNLMLIEDAEPHQQIDAYNMINAINISVGIFTPLAGIMVKELGIVSGERILMGFAVISMTFMILARNHYYKETVVGQQILWECQENPHRKKRKLNLGFLKTMSRKPIVTMVLCLSILFNTYIPIGTYLSLYYAPFLTEALKLDKSSIAILGGINAAVMLLVFIFLIPFFARFNRLYLMISGLLLQISALLMFITIPPGNFLITVICVILFAMGFGMAKPFIDAILAEVTEGKERAAIYAFYNTALSICCAGAGFISGFLYNVHPALIYMVSIGILTICIGFLIWLEVSKRKTSNIQNTEPQLIVTK
jgi:MFS family permease